MKTRFRQLVPLSLAALLFLPELTSAQVVKRQPDVPLVRAASAGCGAANEGFLKILVDASSPVDCDTTPEATIGDWVKALCICRDGSLESVYEGSFLLAGAAPTTAADTCTVNTVAISSTHIAVCVATDTWKRVAIFTWGPE